MSKQTTAPHRLTVPAIARRKGDVPIVCLTAYTAPMARLLDPHVDLLLVGDSLGNVIYGFDSTLPVTLDMMVAHGAAVVRGSSRALVVVDMPFASYQASPADAFRACARVMAETGCGAVKLEGGAEMAETIAFLTARGIPVMGHVGLKPQSVHAHGGYRFQGRDEAAARAIVADAAAVAAAGAFSVVVEAVAEPVAVEIARTVPVPIIGIGASRACDGQVLVAEDMLGLFPGFTPKFVRRFADMAALVDEAAAAYAEEVRARTFPGPEQCFAVRSAAAV
jgi:3-methyl-2-oxobutanoate hydroxymethyltransferase